MPTNQTQTNLTLISRALPLEEPISKSFFAPKSHFCANQTNGPRPIFPTEIDHAKRGRGNGQGYQMAKFDLFLSLDCARVAGVGVAEP